MEILAKYENIPNKLISTFAFAYDYKGYLAKVQPVLTLTFYYYKCLVQYLNHTYMYMNLCQSACTNHLIFYTLTINVATDNV